MADLPLFLQPLKRPHLILERHGGIDAVQLVQIDPLELEPTQAALAGGAQVRGLAVRRPLIRPGALESALRRDHQLWRIGGEGFGDEPFAHLRAVGVGGVEEIDPQLQGAPQHGDRLGAVARLTPDAAAGEAHRTKARLRGS